MKSPLSFWLYVSTVVKSKMEIFQNFAAFLEYMNFTNGSVFQNLRKIRVRFFQILWPSRNVLNLLLSMGLVCLAKNQLQCSWIQISRKHWKGSFLKFSHQMITPLVSRVKRKWFKHPKNKKLVLNSLLQTYQILTNVVLKRSCFISS